ncbi:TetR family transcriptional regulator [Halobacteriovorax marinus]|uniref:TetR family transcriptional regulator n=1 Tax=Halobacteriovorax marinus TaxID=97084 RepID=A0A1Y5FBQ8_9BACT|nr:TetR family transcriptional regulator [Halobacteriovorax marinus]
MNPSKKEILISGALKVFYENGFHASGMDLIAKEVGISKTSIYKHFRTKEDLILAVLELRDHEFRKWLINFSEKRASTPKEQILAIFDAHDEWFNQKGYKGCMFIKASSEYQSAQDPIHRISAQHKRLILDFVEEKSKWMGASEPRELAEQINLLIEGSIVVAKMLGPQNVIKRAKKTASLLLENSIA